MSNEPSDEQIITRLRELLKDVDLQTTTERKLRKTLEEEFEADLSSRKEIVRAEVTRYLEEQPAEEEGENYEASEKADADIDGDTSSHRPAKRKARGGFGGGWLSADMQEFLGEESLPRTQVVKRLWEYIKANNLQNPQDRRRIILDDKLSKLFKPPLTMLTINKQVSRHVKQQETYDDVDDGNDDGAAPPKRAAWGAAKKRKQKAVDPDAPKRSGGFQKKYPLSEDMAEWVGAPEASRAELVSHFWKYVKENGLQDPSNKQIIIADDPLFKLIGERTFGGFGVSKYLNKHILSSKT